MADGFVNRKHEADGEVLRMEENIHRYEQCYYYKTLVTGWKLQKFSDQNIRHTVNFRAKKCEFTELLTEYVEYGEQEKRMIHTAVKSIVGDRIGHSSDIHHIILRHDPEDMVDPRNYIRDCSPFYYKGDREPKGDLPSIVIPPLANSEGEWLSLRDIAEQYQLMDRHKLTAFIEFFYANLFRDDTLVILLEDACFSYEAERSCYRQAAEWMLFLHMIVPKCCGGYNEYTHLRQKLKYCVTNKADGHDGSICFIPRRAGSFLSNQNVFDYTRSYADTPTDSLYAMIARKIQEDLCQNSQIEQDSMQHMQDFLMKLVPNGTEFVAHRLNLRHLSLSYMVKAFNSHKQSMRFLDAAALIPWKEASLKEHLKKDTFTSFDVNVCVDYLRHLETFAEQGGREQIPAGESLEILWRYLSEDSEQYLNEMLFLMTCSAASDEKQKKSMLLRMADKETFLQRYCQQPDNYLYALADRAVSSVEAMKDFCELLRSFFPQSKNVALALTERLCGKAAEEEALAVAYANFCACMDGWMDDECEQTVHAQFLASFLQKAEAYCQEQTDQAGEWLNRRKAIIQLCEESAKLSGDRENSQESLQKVKRLLCQYIEAEVQTKHYTHLFWIEPSFDKIGFLRLWGKVGVSDYSAVYEVISEPQRKALTFFDTKDLPTTEEMPEEEAEKGWISYTIFLLYCMLLSDEPNTYFTDKDTVQQLQEMIKDYKWETSEEHKIIRDFLCLPKIMERHKAGHCPEYFAMANHVSPKYKIYKELYPHYNNGDIGNITEEEQTAYPAANNLLAYAWLCVIVPEIIVFEQAYEQSDNAVDEETLCEMFQVAFPNQYKNVLTENEQEKLLTRIQTLAQQFLDNRSNSGTDNRTASGKFYCILAQYPAFHDWLTAHAETIYTECLTSMVQRCVFYNSLKQDANRKKAMEAIIEKHIQGMVCDDLKTVLEELHQQRQTIDVNAYQRDEFDCLTIKAAQENVNDHLHRLTHICPFEVFHGLPHEEQKHIVHTMQEYSDLSEYIRKIMMSGTFGNMKSIKMYDMRSSQLQLMMYPPYYLEASIYYDEAKRQYDFSAIKDNKGFFSRHYKNISPRTLKYVAYAAYMYVHTTGGEYFTYFRNSLDTNKILFKEDKTFLLAYLIWLLKDFQNCLYSTTDRSRDVKVEKALDACMRKIGVVFENVNIYIDNVLLTRDELYRILWEYAPVGSHSWFQTSDKNNESFFKEYDCYCQLQRALKNNSTDAVYNIYRYACYAYKNNNVMTDEEKKQLYALLKQSYDKMGRNDKYRDEFGDLTAPSDDAESVFEPASVLAAPSESETQSNAPSSVLEQDQKAVHEKKQDTLISEPKPIPEQSQKTMGGTALKYVNAADVCKPAEALSDGLKPAETVAHLSEEMILTEEDKVFLQWKRLSTEENIRRFEECMQNGCFDEETQKLWHQWLGLYSRIPAHLRKFISDSNEYIYQELAWLAFRDNFS